jgi:hypothetical protein
VIEALRAAFPGSTLGRIPKHERGMLYLSKERREALAQVRAIAHEDGRTDAEARALMARAGRLAVEQLIARRAKA